VKKGRDIIAALRPSNPISSVILILTTLLIGDVWGQQPNKATPPPPAPLLPAEQAWLRSLPASPAAAGIMDARRVYVPLQEGGTLALDRETGETAWTNPFGAPWPLVLAPSLVVAVNTGEVAAFMLRDVGAAYVIVGHSERRQYYGETDQVIAQKVQAALGAGLQVILCVGESLEQRNRGIEVQVVAGQLRGCLGGLTASDLDRIIVAYEPIWAIGTGIAATPEQAQEMHGLIRQAFAEKISEPGAAQLRILYGGSVKPDNIQGLMSGADIDGVLVGGASLSAESFAKIVNYR